MSVKSFLIVSTDDFTTEAEILIKIEKSDNESFVTDIG